jgi:hypothetical protein
MKISTQLSPQKEIKSACDSARQILDPAAETLRPLVANGGDAGLSRRGSLLLGELVGDGSGRSGSSARRGITEQPVVPIGEGGPRNAGAVERNVVVR